MVSLDRRMTHLRFPASLSGSVDLKFMIPYMSPVLHSDLFILQYPGMVRQRDRERYFPYRRSLKNGN